MGTLEIIIVILCILWLVGGFAFHVGPLIHILLAVALIVLVIRLLQK